MQIEETQYRSHGYTHKMDYIHCSVIESINHDQSLIAQQLVIFVTGKSELLSKIEFYAPKIC